MIFINPKIDIDVKEIEFIIRNLCNGYCFSAIQSFGLFGSTKELFRQIGMFDERFIFGEWEDVDFLCRLSIFNKAIIHTVDTQAFGKPQSTRSPLRGISKTKWENKYITDPLSERPLYLNPDHNKPKQISKRHKNSNKIISDSWLDKSLTVTQSGRWLGGEKYKQMIYDGKMGCYESMLGISNKHKEKIVLDNITLIIKYNINDNKIIVECLSNQETRLLCHILTPYPERHLIIGDFVRFNTWKSFPLDDYHIKNGVEIRIFHDDLLYYINTLDLDNNFEFKNTIKQPIKLHG